MIAWAACIQSRSRFRGKYSRMHILSAVSYFFSAHSFLAMPVIVLLSGALAIGMIAWRKNRAWALLVVPGMLFAGINVFTSHIVNALFLNAFGVTGSAVIVHSRETSSQLNNQNVWEYDAVVKTADGRDVTTKFDTMSASIYPIRNEILIPPEGESFVVKYVPGFERNIVILSDESDYGRRRLVREDLEPVEKAMDFRPFRVPGHGSSEKINRWRRTPDVLV